MNYVDATHIINVLHNATFEIPDEWVDIEVIALVVNTGCSL